MIGKASDSGLELLKTIWLRGGRALPARITDALAEKRPLHRIHGYRCRSGLRGFERVLGRWNQDERDI